MQRSLSGRNSWPSKVPRSPRSAPRAAARARLEQRELQLLAANGSEALYYGALRDGEGVLRLRVSGPRLELEVAASDWEAWLALAGLAMGAVKG